MAGPAEFDTVEDAPAADGGPDPTRRQAWFVVLVITALAALIIVTMAFSTTNTSQSVDGRSATTATNLLP